MNAKWVRVTKKSRCVICDHADWCTHSPELGLAHCMRVESDRPSRNSMGGWLHRIGEGERRGVVYVRRSPPEPPRVDFQGMWRRWFEETEHYHVDGFAMSLGVGTAELRALGCAWTGREWAFPMRDEEGRVIGVRLRGNDGSKWAVKGSRNGLFIPEGMQGGTVWIVEGPTDAAAALTLGLNAIGRPSCSACDEMVTRYLRRRGFSRAVIITDNDRPDTRGVVAGVRGAEKLQKALPVMNCVYTPPTKDLREFVNSGGNRLLLESMLKDLVWQHPTGAVRPW